MRRRRQPEIIAGRVDTTAGAVVACTHDIAVQRNGVGTTTVTLPPGFRLIAVTVAPYTSGNVTALTLPPRTERSFTMGMITVTSAPAAADGIIEFVAVGVQA